MGAGFLSELWIDDCHILQISWGGARGVNGAAYVSGYMECLGIVRNQL